MFAVTEDGGKTFRLLEQAPDFRSLRPIFGTKDVDPRDVEKLVPSYLKPENNGLPLTVLKVPFVVRKLVIPEPMIQPEDITIINYDDSDEAEDLPIETTEETDVPTEDEVDATSTEMVEVPTVEDEELPTDSADDDIRFE